MRVRDGGQYAVGFQPSFDLRQFFSLQDLTRRFVLVPRVVGEMYRKDWIDIDAERLECESGDLVADVAVNNVGLNGEDSAFF